MDPMRAERRGDARKRILMAMLAVLTRSAVSASFTMTEKALQNEPLSRTSRRRSRRSGGAIPSGWVP